jgi:Region found in RelA / SpoT proteins
MQTGLRRYAREVSTKPLLAQRLKRVPSIVEKLRRFPTMNLSRMQDVGGCRAVLKSVAEVRRLRRVYESSRIKHMLIREDDYITHPKRDGYRGVHLVYRYYSDRAATYNGLQIEIQLRSRLQHAWATSVETVGTFLNQPLKANVGPEAWKHFFTLTGSIFAATEKTPLVEGTPQNRENLKAEARALAQRLQVRNVLTAFGTALRITEEEEQPDVRYYLLVLNPESRQLSINGYARAELERATESYLAYEKLMVATPGSQVVLVAADSLESLRRAYPNYFLDTEVFLRAIHDIVE